MTPDREQCQVCGGSGQTILFGSGCMPGKVTIRPVPCMPCAGTGKSILGLIFSDLRSTEGAETGPNGPTRQGG
jgi:DnaJ-class molecular chaperone